MTDPLKQTPWVELDRDNRTVRITATKDGWISLYVTALARARKLEISLRHLSNEVLASLPLMEPMARREFGNTNYNLLIQRAEEARELLTRPPDELKGED